MDQATETTFVEVMDRTARIFEVVAVGVLVVGLLWSLALAAVIWARTRTGHHAFVTLREAFGGTLLLAVEVLVAADLIRTIAVEPTIENVAVLGLVVVIRTFLSFSLEVEIEGVLPWRRAMSNGVTRSARAARRALAVKAEPPPTHASADSEDRGGTPT